MLFRSGSKDAIRAGFTEEVTLDPRHQGDEEVSHTDIWGRSIPGRGSSAKALRQGCGWWFFKFKFIYLFILFWLHWVFIAARRLSLAAVSGGYSSLWCAGFSLPWLLLLWSTGSRRAGFSSCGARA